MTRTMRVSLTAVLLALAVAATPQAQRPAPAEWTTVGNDAQRTAWVRSDAALTKAAVQKGRFAFLWKAQFDNDPRQLNSLTEPMLQDRLIGYLGFKSLAFVGASADRVFAIDTDLARPYWTAHLNYGVSTGGQPPSTPDCPGGLIATPTRRTAVYTSWTPPATTGGFGRGGGMASAVGEPGKGAAILSQRASTSAAAPAPPAAPRNDATPAAPTSSAVAPVSWSGVDRLYAVGADGLLRSLRVSDGAEASTPIPFIPPSAKPSSLIFLEDTVYTATSNGCGAAPNAVWAMDLAPEEGQRKAIAWKTGGASIIGAAGVAFGADGTLYVTVGSGLPIGTNTSTATDGQGSESSYSNAVVALDRRTLRPKDWFTLEPGTGASANAAASASAAPSASFSTSPMVIHHHNKDLVAVAGADGKLYLLDGASLGGSDHKTPLAVSAKYSSAAVAGALATWDDGTTRWILAPGEKSIVAFKLVEQNGALALEQGWQSRDLVSPLAPIIVNGLVIAASSGEYRGSDAASLTAAARAQKSTPAVLYVLDGLTGREMWSSGSTITSFARAGLSAGGGQVYLVTYDNHLYAFGIPMEH